MYKGLIILLWIILLPLLCSAATIHVPGDSATIQAGINGTAPGDTILVADGTYTGEGNRDISYDGKDIVVLSENGPEFTILNMEGTESEPHRAFNFITNEPSSAELIGFTFKNGYGTYSNNHNEGGAIYIVNSSPSIKECVFENNVGNHTGGAVVCWGYLAEPKFISCTFVNNTALYYGAGVYINTSNDVIFENCIIAFSNYGAAIFGGNVELSCCNLYGNDGGDWDASIPGQLGINGNISADPVFCDTSSGDFNLAPHSPCGPFVHPSCDLIGALGVECYENYETPYPLMITLDPIYSGDLLTSPNPEIIWTFFDTASTTQSAYEIEVGTDNDWSIAELWQTGQVTSSDSSVQYMGLPLIDNTQHFVRIRLSNSLSWGSWKEFAFWTRYPTTIRIPADKLTIQAGIDSAINNGDTVLVSDGIYTGEGNKNLDFMGKNIVLKSVNGPKATIIDCEFDGRGIRFHLGEDSTCVVDGFKITNGWTDHESGSGILIIDSDPTIKNCEIRYCACHHYGGGVGCGNSNSTFINCLITENAVIHGGAGVYSEYSNPRFINCSISGNYQAHGIMVQYSQAEFNNCSISNNHITGIHIIQSDVDLIGCTFHKDTILYGPVVFSAAITGNGGNLNIVNSTFSENVSSNGRGAIHLDGCSLNMENSIIAFTSDGIAIDCDSEDIISISCCNIYGNTDGDWVGGIAAYEGINGNLSLDPMFCDSYNGILTLDSTSPCGPDHPSNTCQVLIGAHSVTDCVNCGDANFDGYVNVSDAVYIINYVFINGDQPDPYDYADVNCDSYVNVSDAVWIINYTFMGGFAPCDTDGDTIPDC
jgi:Right handed beta helix region/Dockerin type I domain